MRPTASLFLLASACAAGPLAGLPAQDSGAASPPRYPTPAERLEDSPRHHEWVKVAAPGDREVATFVVYPESAQRRPVVLLIHENRGLNDWMRALADQVAEAGFIAMAPDLLSGTGPEGGGTASFESTDAARTGIYALPPEQVLSDLDAVVQHGLGIEAGSKQVVVAGFCWGGSQSFRMACHSAGIAAACVFYGSAPVERSELERVRVPVHGFYGGNDARITSRVPELANELEDLGKTFEPATYAGAGHAFMRRGETEEPGTANREARDAAWRRFLGILEGVAAPAPAQKAPPR